MKAHELISLIKTPLEKLKDENINPSLVKHLDMFYEYSRMCNEGFKKTYIVAHLCDKYKLKKTRFFELVNCFDMEV